MIVFLDIVGLIVYWLVGVFVIAYVDQFWDRLTNKHNETWDPEKHGDVMAVTGLALIWPIAVIVVIVLGFAAVTRKIMRKAQN